MKRLIILLSLCLCIGGIAAAQLSRNGTMYVAAKSADLKASTGFFAKNQGKLSYGAQVTVLQVNGKWAQVRSASNASLNGWTASSNLTAKRVVSSSASAASAKEVALAGKGFNQEVENAYKTKGKLNYADVDRTERQTVSEKDLYNFLHEGHLAMGDQ